MDDCGIFVVWAGRRRSDKESQVNEAVRTPLTASDDMRTAYGGNAFYLIGELPAKRGIAGL